MDDLGASMRANLASAENNQRMSENWGANIDTRAPALPSQQAGRASGTEPATETQTPPVPQSASVPAAVPASAPVGTSGSAGVDATDRRHGATSRAEEGLTTDEIATLTPAVTPTSITAALTTPAALTVGTVGRAWRALVEAVGDLLDGREGIWALEAGAGTRTLFDLPEDAFIVGVDRDPRALESNVRLDQRVGVELDDYRPLAAGFDLITSWYVLDDLNDPAPVLDRFAEWTGEDGLIVLAVPNLRSPRGIVARMTGRAKLRRSLTPRALRRRFADRGFVPVFQVYFEDGDQAALRRRFRVTHGWWKAGQALVRMVTLGLLDAARTDYIVVFRRVRPTDRRGLHSGDDANVG